MLMLDTSKSSIFRAWSIGN